MPLLEKIIRILRKENDLPRQGIYASRIANHIGLNDLSHVRMYVMTAVHTYMQYACMQTGLERDGWWLMSSEIIIRVFCLVLSSWVEAVPSWKLQVNDDRLVELLAFFVWKAGGHDRRVDDAGLFSRWYRPFRGWAVSNSTDCTMRGRLSITDTDAGII